MIDKIYNSDCIEFMRGLTDVKINCIMTSPPYNTGRPYNDEYYRQMYDARYDVYIDEKTPEEYIQWTDMLFNLFNGILKENGVIIYNISYSSDSSVNNVNCDTVWRVISHIIEETPFTVADRIIWKKSCALPNNMSKNKLTRICEDVFVFCRKSEYLTFNCNKEVSSIRDTGQLMYKNYFNYIEARNNDGACDLNKATYSTDLVVPLLKLYCKPGDTIYDPFMGTGTTAVAAKSLGMHYIGTEISEAQCKYAENRILNMDNTVIKTIDESTGQETTKILHKRGF